MGGLGGGRGTKDSWVARGVGRRRRRRGVGTSQKIADEGKEVNNFMMYSS